MQKIDFVKNLEILVEKLQSQEIVDAFDEGFRIPSSPYNYNILNPLLFKSKSNYDQLITFESLREILENINSINIYAEQNLSALSSIFLSKDATKILLNNSSVVFYLFHKTLVNTWNLSKNVLLNNNILQENFEDKIENGVILFQILIESEGLEPEKYIKIFSALDDLINTLEKVYDESDEKTEIILLDSGSDTNLGIKTGIETAKSLFLIFKEIWDFIVNFKYYKAEKKNKALLDSLSIRTEINKKVEEGVLTEKEGLEYTHIIKTRTDDLIGMKVLPKSIVTDSNLIENKKILSEFEGLKLISGKE
ncbi:hypothetical protein [Chryseobacterium sp. W4I1]|uniref:hypothetical protein n=1 Tax=Chryseobacterium sp. W4I1 TaxID=3042293 RepID=UPI002783D708|nr:hypothetical protein [Chryseobacterium sp. W4I1]MDQ0783193.1 hypothetical protein [Chryseobacterium sp. W4I1]